MGGFFVCHVRDGLMRFRFMSCRKWWLSRTGSQRDAICRRVRDRKISAPGTVEITILIDTLEAVRTEEVALALNEIGRAERLREAVEIAER